METAQWIALFKQAFCSMDKKLEQVLQLNSCREHWIQAEISLHAWIEENIEIWTDLPICGGQKADLYAQDKSGATSMVAEVKCLGDASQAKCLEGDWSVRAYIERISSFNTSTRLFVLVIAKGEQESNTGKRLRTDTWVEGCESINLDLGHALIRIWAL